VDRQAARGEPGVLTSGLLVSGSHTALSSLKLYHLAGSYFNVLQVLQHSGLPHLLLYRAGFLQFDSAQRGKKTQTKHSRESGGDLGVFKQSVLRAPWSPAMVGALHPAALLIPGAALPARDAAWTRTAGVCGDAGGWSHAWVDMVSIPGDAGQPMQVTTAAGLCCLPRPHSSCRSSGCRTPSPPAPL